jgi:hypothetical protein
MPCKVGGVGGALQRGRAEHLAIFRKKVHAATELTLAALCMERSIMVV